MSTVEVKTADLIGPALDWAVAKAIEEPLCEEACQGDYILIGTGNGDLKRFSPSTDWIHGGPLIDKHRFEFEWVGSDWHGEPLQFFTACGCDMPADATSTGPSHLIAACRTIVRAKLGDIVKIPEELANPA